MHAPRDRDPFGAPTGRSFSEFRMRPRSRNADDEAAARDVLRVILETDVERVTLETDDRESLSSIIERLRNRKKPRN